MSLLDSFVAGQSEAQVEAAIAAERLANAPQFPDLVEPVVPARSAGLTTTAALVANAIYLYRFRVAKPVTIGNANIYIAGTPAGNIALGVYTESGGTWTRVAATADTAASATNAVQTIPLAAPITLQPGIDYWACIGGTNATITLLRAASLVIGAVGALNNMTLTKTAVYSSGLPASLTTPVGTTLPFWMSFTT